MCFVFLFRKEGDTGKFNWHQNPIPRVVCWLQPWGQGMGSQAGVSLTQLRSPAGPLSSLGLWCLP